MEVAVTKFALSSTVSKITDLSSFLRDAIPIMNLCKEMIAGAASNDINHCRVFENNSGALEIAKVAQYRPQSKHPNIRIHHYLFRSYVNNGQISSHKTNALDQPADLLAKPLNAETFKKFRKMVMGWQ